MASGGKPNLLLAAPGLQCMPALKWIPALAEEGKQLQNQAALGINILGPKKSDLLQYM